MTRRYWITTAVWILLIVGAAPLVVEILDDAGLGITFPGLFVTGGEILATGLLAAIPPILAACNLRRSRVTPAPPDPR
jgi:hypothetical protein